MSRPPGPARALVEALGGAANLVAVEVDFTRVSIWLAEPDLVDEEPGEPETRPERRP